MGAAAVHALWQEEEVVACRCRTLVRAHDGMNKQAHAISFDASGADGTRGSRLNAEARWQRTKSKS